MAVELLDPLLVALVQLAAGFGEFLGVVGAQWQYDKDLGRALGDLFPAEEASQVTAAVCRDECPELIEREEAIATWRQGIESKDPGLSECKCLLPGREDSIGRSTSVSPESHATVFLRRSTERSS